jgi:hypothetical protein
MEGFVTLFLILSFLLRLFVAQLWLGLGDFRVPVQNCCLHSFFDGPIFVVLCSCSLCMHFPAVSADEKSPTPLRNQERGISGGASQESRLQTSMAEVLVKMCIPEAQKVSAYFTGLVVLKHL